MLNHFNKSTSRRRKNTAKIVLENNNKNNRRIQMLSNFMTLKKLSHR